jgi:hypothetical protein
VPPSEYVVHVPRPLAGGNRTPVAIGATALACIEIAKATGSRCKLFIASRMRMDAGTGMK